MPQWEYFFLEYPSDSGEKADDMAGLNKLGREHWELVCVTTRYGPRSGCFLGYRYYFKRPLDA